jgi:hypothetical protein
VPSEPGRLFLSVQGEGSYPRLVEVACNPSPAG